MPTNAAAALTPGVSVATYGGNTSITVPANDIRIYATDAEIWGAWNLQYATTSATTAAYINSPMTVETAHRIQQQLNALAHEAQVTGNIWTNWNIQYLASSVILTATNTTATAVTTSAATNNVTWTHWVQDASARQRAVAQPSEEQRERWRQDEIRRRTEADKRVQEELAAKDKAIVLLKSCLNKQQIEEFEKRNHFHLHVGDQIYRIDRGSHGNVKLIDKDGRVKRSFCIHPQGVPEGDTMLAQKLLLQTNEEGFYESANVTEYDKDGRSLGVYRGSQAVDILRRERRDVPTVG